MGLVVPVQGLRVHSTPQPDSGYLFPYTMDWTITAHPLDYAYIHIQ